MAMMMMAMMAMMAMVAMVWPSSSHRRRRPLARATISRALPSPARYHQLLRHRSLPLSLCRPHVVSVCLPSRAVPTIAYSTPAV